MNASASATLGTQPFRTTCTIGPDGRHEFVCDEPTDLGGQDLGPTPVEIFCASVAACKAMTARMYANRKEWIIEGVSCSVTHDLRVQEGGPKPTTLVSYARTRTLLSGFLEGGEAIADQPAWSTFEHGLGRVHLFGFRPQYRAWSAQAFHLLFRALLIDP